MFFSASKILWPLFAPSHLFVIFMALTTAILFTPANHLECVLTALCAAGLIVIGFTPLPNLLLRRLEDRFPKKHLEDNRSVDCIVVLSGGLGLDRDQITVNKAGARIIAALELAKRHPRARIILSGGSSLTYFGSEREAHAAIRFLRAAGIESERLITETRSRNTRENALFTRNIIEPQVGERWLLVTSAFHMPRAFGCFRAVGIILEAYPVDYRAAGKASYLLPFESILAGLKVTDLAVKEWIGLIAYRLAGYTGALLPHQGSE